MAWPRFLRKLFGGADEPEKLEIVVPPAVAEPGTTAEAPAAAVAADATAADAADADDDDDDDEDDDDEDDDDDDDDDDEDDDDPDALPKRHPELEANLRAARHDPAPHRIFADWLQQQGDPRGELVAVQLELELPSHADRRGELRDRERELLRTHHREIIGPLDDEHSQVRFGFLRHLRVDRALPRGSKLARALEHPAYLLLDSLTVEDRDVDRVRAALVEIGRDDVRVTTEDDYVPDPSLVPSIIATVRVTAAEDGRRWIEMWCDDNFGMQGGSHSFLVRTTLESGRWSYGCDGSLCEDGLADDPVRSEMFVCAPTDREVTCELRFGIENEAVVAMHFRGTASLPEGVGEVEIALARCEPFTGTPFEPSPTSERLATSGPELVRERAWKSGCVPEHGVLTSERTLVTPTGDQALSGFAPDGIMNECTGGADGTIVAGFSARWTKDFDKALKSILAFTVLPDVTPVHVPQPDYIVGLYALSGARVGVVTTTAFVLFDAHTGIELWRRALEPLESGRNGNWNLALVEHDGRLHLLRNDRVTSLAFDTGAADASWPLSTMVTTMNNYGVGQPTFHPAPERAAWMSCGSSGECGFPPVAIVGWRDRDGTCGEVAIAEQGWARTEDAFGKIAVLPDGRIVAVGESVWLVEPPSTTPIRIGAPGGYNGPLQLTRHQERWRLWNPGAGAWYLEFD